MLNFEDVMTKAAQGLLPATRNTVEECVPHAFMALMDVFNSEGKAGAAKLASELDALIVCAKNPRDPVWVGQDALTRNAAWSILNMFTFNKEQAKNAHRAKEASEKVGEEAHQEVD